MSRVYVEPGNPHDISREELEELSALVRAEQSGLTVEVFIGEEQGYGVTFAEVLRIYMEAGELAGDTAALLAPLWIAVRWMRSRWQKDNESHREPPRARYVTLFGRDGTIIKSIKIDVPDGEPTEVKEPQSLHVRPWPPDRRGSKR